MSRDFFRVSSTLQAVKRAAAAASWFSMSMTGASKVCRTHYVAIIAICIQQSKLMVVDDGRIECPHGSVNLINTKPKPTEATKDLNIQFQRPPNILDPLYASESNIVLTDLTYTRAAKTLVNSLLENVWLGHLDVVGHGPDTGPVGVYWRHSFVQGNWLPSGDVRQLRSGAVTNITLVIGSVSATQIGVKIHPELTLALIRRCRFHHRAS